MVILIFLKIQTYFIEIFSENSYFKQNYSILKILCSFECINLETAKKIKIGNLLIFKIQKYFIIKHFVLYQKSSS